MQYVGMTTDPIGENWNGNNKGVNLYQPFK